MLQVITQDPFPCCRYLHSESVMMGRCCICNIIKAIHLETFTSFFSCFTPTPLFSAFSYFYQFPFLAWSCHWIWFFHTRVQWYAPYWVIFKLRKKVHELPLWRLLQNTDLALFNKFKTTSHACFPSKQLRSAHLKVPLLQTYPPREGRETKNVLFTSLPAALYRLPATQTPNSATENF